MSESPENITQNINVEKVIDPQEFALAIHNARVRGMRDAISQLHLLYRAPMLITLDKPTLRFVAQTLAFMIDLNLPDWDKKGNDEP